MEVEVTGVSTHMSYINVTPPYYKKKVGGRGMEGG